jgi:hypothetical protein
MGLLLFTVTVVVSGLHVSPATHTGALPTSAVKFAV